jgi:hypothetical protein
VASGGRPERALVGGEDLLVGPPIRTDFAGVVPAVCVAELAPGCSLAMTMPIMAEAAMAARTAARVRWRNRASVRSRDSGELY